MLFQLRKPCKHCPFVKADTRIKFRGRDRATEIAELAYRQGFPCHESADWEENEDGTEEGTAFGEKTQHCAGALALFINSGYDCWPGVDNDERVVEKAVTRLDKAFVLVFDSEEDFIEANADPDFDGEEDKAA